MLFKIISHVINSERWIFFPAQRCSMQGFQKAVLYYKIVIRWPHR